MLYSTDPAELVQLLRFWPDQFSQGKSKIPFLQKASNKPSASVILGFIRPIILYRKGIAIKWCKIIGRPRIPFIVMLTRYSVVQKLSNKQNGA